MSMSVNNVLPELTGLLNSPASCYVPSIFDILVAQRNNGWKFFVVDQNCGRCHYGPKIVTIPKFAFGPRAARGEGYSDWYLAHELAHTYAGWQAKHGPLFMQELKRICPPSFLRYEYNYKPANAIKAGIYPEFTDKELF